ncbi:MAG TPA: tRNA pseudouridine(13) synthase TruD [Polyangiaceae bacterium]|nr:tRNA pseudouridine(13) synthase TruD [Polyangiaceae bacterium]
MKPRATIKRTPQDFVVEEIPAFPPSGEGEHLYVRITKTNITTNDAVKRICAALAVDERGAGYAGMKDKRAVTRQTISVPFPTSRAPSEAMALSVEGIEIASAERHPHKLRPGHLKGNRFTITLRDLPAKSVAGVREALGRAGRIGVPNSFGPQRFGRDGDNSERAWAWLTGRAKGPSDRRERRLLFSALQADLFNRVLERRLDEGTWNRPLTGDLMKKTDTGGLFLCDDREGDTLRAERREICPTGPIYGVKMRWPEGEPLAIERAVLEAATGQAGGVNPFEANGALGEGSRRPFVLHPIELAVESVDEPTKADAKIAVNGGGSEQMRHSGVHEGQDALRVLFVLPKGGYATTLLNCAVALHEETVNR